MSWTETMVERTSWLKAVRRGRVLVHKQRAIRVKVLAATAEGVMMRRADDRRAKLSSSRWHNIYREWRLEVAAREVKSEEVKSEKGREAA